MSQRSFPKTIGGRVQCWKCGLILEIAEKDQPWFDSGNPAGAGQWVTTCPHCGMKTFFDIVHRSPMKAGTIITDCLGRERPVTVTYPAGDYDCPFCATGISINLHEDFPACPNPGCPATPGANPEVQRAIIAKEEARVAEEAERKRNHARAMERITQEKESQLAADTAKIREAVAAGQCLTCLIRSGFRKLVKHRKECPAK